MCSLNSYILLLPETVLLIQMLFQANKNSVNCVFTENRVVTQGEQTPICYYLVSVLGN